MENKKLLIIGGGGYIGNHVIDEALKSGRKATVLDIFYFGHNKLRRHADNPNLEIVTADIREISCDVFKGIDEVISLAGISNDPSCDLLPEITESTNLHGCIRVAKLAKEAGVKRFIDMSSCSVYGKAEKPICDESSPTFPVSLYAKCKLGVEQAILPLASNDFCITSLRNATTFGPSERMRFDLVVNIMTFNALLRRFIKVSGDGRQGRPLIHVNDIAKICIELLGVDPHLINGEIFNVVSENLDVADIAEIVKKVVSGIAGDDIKIGYFDQDFDIRTYKVSGEKLRKTIGICPKHSVGDGVREITANLQNGRIVDSLDCHTVKFYKHLFNK